MPFLIGAYFITHLPRPLIYADDKYHTQKMTAEFPQISRRKIMIFRSFFFAWEMIHAGPSARKVILSRMINICLILLFLSL